MERHGFDVLSALFGAVFVTIATTHLLSGVVDFDVPWDLLWPLVVIVAGVGLLWSALRRSGGDS
jgi:hypothetical protein